MKKIKKKIHNKLMAYLFNAVTEDDFLQIIMRKDLQGEKPHSIMLGNEVLDVRLVNEYKSQAKAILQMPIWNVLTKSAQWTAHEKIFKKCENGEDLLYPRAMLYELDIINKKLKNIANIEN